MNVDGQYTNRSGCGKEIRFNLNGDKAQIRMKLAKKPASGTKVSRALVYYGSIAAGYPECVKDIGNDETVIELVNSDKIEWLKKISKENNYAFDPSLIRLVLDHLPVNLIDIVGDITPPKPEQTPNLRYLAYGSSITNGSHGLIPTNTYTSHTARLLNADLINLGFPSSARLESGVADYIASRNDWDFATLEMGINILSVSCDDYRKRVEYFIKTIAQSHPEKPVFCIDVFYCFSDLYKDEKADCFRKIMKETIASLNLQNVIYVNGLSVLDGSYGLSSDIVHLNNTTTALVGKRLADIISKTLKGMKII